MRKMRSPPLQASTSVSCVAVLCVQCSRCGSYASHMEACWGTSEHGQGEIPARGCEPRQLVGCRSHAVEKKAMIYIHKQTRLLIYITIKPALGENWGRRGSQGQNTSCTQNMKSTSFPFSFFNNVSCKIKGKKSSFLHKHFFVFASIQAFHWSIVSAFLISQKKQQKAQCHTIFCSLSTQLDFIPI